MKIIRSLTIYIDMMIKIAHSDYRINCNEYWVISCNKTKRLL